MATEKVDVAIIGAGIIGISVAYYLVHAHDVKNIVLIDEAEPMSLTSAQSGENYRNWWPDAAMTAFTNDSITLMEEIARESDNRIAMTRRGYVLATRRTRPDDLIDELWKSYGEQAKKQIRFYESGACHTSYRPALSADWQFAPDGVDVLLDRSLIAKNFPYYADDVAAILHVRRAGAISSQQLGQFMLEKIREKGGRILRKKLVAIEQTAPFWLRFEADNEPLQAQRIVNAAGAFCRDIAALLGEDCPLHCVYQQKIAFEDKAGAIARTMPFTIDLDRQRLAWNDEERQVLAQDEQMTHLLREMQGNIHCRPDGVEASAWIKLGWAYNHTPTDPHAEEPIDPHFPDIVLRAASRLHPKLACYIGRLSRGIRHYGGYYTMTKENLPLIGPMQTPNAFIAGGLSGYGTMAAAISGALCAAWMEGSTLPPYAGDFSLKRYENPDLLRRLEQSGSRSHL